MRRFLSYILAALLALSLAGNGALVWVAWRAQQEYRALARQFVKAKQDLAKAEQQARAAAAPTHPTPPAAGEKSVAAEPAPRVSAPAPAPTGSVAEIQLRFEPGFRAVQAECEGRLDAMLTEAKTEYQKAKAAGANVDVAALGAKYLGRADRLRRDCDRRVEALLDEMGATLRAAGLPTELVAEVRQAYEDRIIERQAEIMAKAP